MTSTSFKSDIQRVCNLVRFKLRVEQRTIVAIAGPPASGKSTLAEAVVRSLNQDHSGAVPLAALLPMDGYHFDNQTLKARGLRARKGAPETFAAAAFCDAVKGLSDVRETTFYPSFDRHLDCTIAQAIAIDPKTPIVIVEGNYLLLTSNPWKSLDGTFAASVFIAPSMDTLRQRLQQRWIAHGLTPDAATERAEANDLRDAKLVLDESRCADLFLSPDRDETGC